MMSCVSIMPGAEIMINTKVKDSFSKLAAELSPFLNISDEAHCDATLELLESFMLEIGDDINHPLMPISNLLEAAVEAFEMDDPEIFAFDAEAMGIPHDAAVSVW
jgi:hypothetical protein